MNRLLVTTSLSLALLQGCAGKSKPDMGIMSASFNKTKPRTNLFVLVRSGIRDENQAIIDLSEIKGDKRGWSQIECRSSDQNFEIYILPSVAIVDDIAEYIPNAYILDFNLGNTNANTNLPYREVQRIGTQFLDVGPPHMIYHINTTISGQWYVMSASTIKKNDKGWRQTKKMTCHTIRRSILK